MRRAGKNNPAYVRCTLKEMQVVTHGQATHGMCNDVDAAGAGARAQVINRATEFQGVLLVGTKTIAKINDVHGIRQPTRVQKLRGEPGKMICPVAPAWNQQNRHHCDLNAAG
jgi:hypothetical protein